MKDKHIVKDTATLKMLAKAGKIIWPVLINWPVSKKPYPAYVKDIQDVGDSFTHNGIQYELRYLSGCFIPYLFKI